MTSQVPFEILEERAAQQRRQLHNSVSELRSNLRQKLDVKRNAREYLLPAAGVAGLIALVIGWGFGGLFVRD
ncbi:MAG TPA: hypothetical protein VE998_09625 [Terriglobales bacterium]|nr:hypothetical protein [Terriglobales bacterium]